MTRVFVDTSFYIAILSQTDKHHVIAHEHGKVLSNGLITTEFVLLELANFLSRPPLRRLAIELIDGLRNDRGTEVLPVDRVLYQSGYNLFVKRPDKSWSLTDCISFVVMEARGISKALTADVHFEQAGFHPLLKNEP